MDDPVCDKEGNSYEKSAILDWISKHACSPITRTPMEPADLVPNRALKDMILEYFKKPTQPKVVATDPSQTIDPADTVELRTIVDKSKMLVTIDPGDSQTRTFLNVSCVIDVSGSMDCEATFVGENNKRESFGLTILDIVKHAVTTVIKSLSSNDRLAIVTFSDSAEIVLPLTYMDEQGQNAAITILKSLQSDASTNLWAGLEKGLDVLNTIDEQNDYNRVSTVMLFTDGEPNVIPPRGHLPMLQMYKDRRGGLPGIVNTFGFGYSLDSELLNSLAKAGQGGFFFIPDSSFVGTIFVHAIANLKVTIAKTCRLTIEPLNGAVFVDPSKDLGEYLTASDTWGITVDVGSIQTGQTKDILLEMSNLPQHGTAYASVNLNVKTRANNLLTLSAECDSYASNDRVLPTYFRYKFAEVIKNAMKLVSQEGDFVSEAYTLVQNLIKEIENSPYNAESSALLEDIKGQVSEAIKPDYFRKWGRHYLPSLMYAHIYQVCNNFKDAGPQVYGGSLFKQLRDEADTLFSNLPPPKPSRCVPANQSFSTSARFAARSSGPSFSMRMFNNSRNICFHGNGVIRLFDGDRKKVESIVKGDRIETMNGEVATVLCVIMTKITDGMLELSNYKTEDGSTNLLITPWHPIRLSQTQDWIFPASIAEPKSVQCDAVYNFVLDRLHVVNVDNIDCVTLGHSFVDSVCAHEYFGTERVIDDLQAMKGYSSGLVRLSGVQRDPVTSKIIGLIEG